MGKEAPTQMELFLRIYLCKEKIMKRIGGIKISNGVKTARSTQMTHRDRCLNCKIILVNDIFTSIIYERFLTKLHHI
jgi:hypothetical protein